MKWTIPNMLTALRLLAAPMVPVMFLYFARPLADWLALILFAGASVTDWFDGYLARAWKQQTKIGTMLDPIADKAMVIIALLVICGYSTWTPWLVLPATIILFREVFVSGLREYLGDTAGTLAVTKLAKWKTTLQMVAIGFLLAGSAGDNLFPNLDILGSGLGIVSYIGLLLLWISALVTLYTGYDYFRAGIRHLLSEDS